jgi:hypothetical protein
MISIYLFVVYLMTSVTQRRMLESLMILLEIMWKGAVVAQFRYLPCI